MFKMALRIKGESIKFICFRSIRSMSSNTNNSIPINFSPLIKEDEYEEVKCFKPFDNWYKKLSALKQKDIKIDSVKIESIDRFKSNKIGFVKLKVNSTSKENNSKIPGIIVLRGNSVGMLIMLTSKESINAGKEPYILLTSQPRLAASEESLLELPAGMLDEEDNLKVKALEEIKEETGLEFKKDEIKGLGKDGYYSSPGLLDEKIYFFYVKKIMDANELVKVNNKISGLRKDGELITLKLLPFSEILNHVYDLKVLSAYCLYQKLSMK